MNDELLARVERLEEIVFNAPVITHAFMPDGDFTPTYMSGNVERILGYSPNTFLYSKDFWINNIHPDDKLSVFNNFSKLFNFGHHIQEYRFRHANNEWCWMREELRLIRDESGAPKEIIGSWMDITILCQARDEATRAIMFGAYRYMDKVLQQLLRIDDSNDEVAADIKRQCVDLIQTFGNDLEQLTQIENITWDRVESFMARH